MLRPLNLCSYRGTLGWTEDWGGGNSITFESGSGANHNKLTGSYIYNNDVGSKEGARVLTGSGARFVDRCG
jgi:hypothetical protein